MLTVVKQTIGLFYFQGVLLVGALHLNFQSLELVEKSFKFSVIFRHLSSSKSM